MILYLKKSLDGFSAGTLVQAHHTQDAYWYTICGKNYGEEIDPLLVERRQRTRFVKVPTRKDKRAESYQARQ